MAEIVGLALPFSVLFDKLATEEVKNFLRPKKVINKLLEKLEVSLLSANQLLDVAEEKQIEDEMVEKWLNELKDVVYKASELGDKIKTEALRRNLEGHQSASNITKMFTKLCSNLWNLCSNLLSSFDNDVEDELEEILSSLEHLLSQKDALGLVPPGTGRSNDSGVTPATQLEGHQSARNKTTKMFKFFSKNSFHNYVIDELEEILSSLEHLLSRKDELGLKRRSNYSDVTPAVRFRATPLADESGFCGREDIKETIIRSLRSADVRGERIAVIPVIGPGGIGKTTLVQIIYDHPQVKQLFGERAWITVSTEFDLPAIAKRIIRKFSSSSQIDGDDDPQELLFKLRDTLKGRRFLLVLDDVWSEDRDEWDNLKSCFQSGGPGSKIIVTTRSSRVASIAAPNQPLHSLPELPEEDCRRLFEKIVFTGDRQQEARPDLEKIGKKIVEKCKGLPLSVKSVGGILRGDRDREKWERILKSSVWELLQKNYKNIVPSLWLSYRYLPSHLKRCFAYCSIFPEDYRFKKEEVVQLWMAEGLLKNEAGSTMEEVGELYFEELLSRSLFQISYDLYRGHCFIMHDLVHDLAMYVSGKFCFRFEKDKIFRGLASETRHLTYNSTIVDVKKFEGLSKAKRLHSFIGLRPSTLFGQVRSLNILKVLEEVSVEGACLRVLSISSSANLYSLPDSVGKLKHLRYLNLSNTAVEELPHYVSTLYNLQTLLLSRCENLKQLPESIGNLKQLRYLDLSYSDVRELPDSIGTLYNLQTLLLSNCHNLTRLPSNQGRLINLHHLDIIYLPKLEFLGNWRYGSLKDLKIKKCDALKSIPLDCFPKLNRFTLRECENFESFRFAKGPPLALEYLILISLPKFVSFPEGGLPAPNLKEFEIEECENLRSLPQQMRRLLPSLNKLLVDNCGEIESWPEGGLPSNLESLEISGCKKLAAQVMHWDLQVTCLRELTIDGCGEELLDSFPPEGLLPTSLTSLEIRNFRRFKTLDTHTFQHLRYLSVYKCGELECLSEESLANSLSDMRIYDCPLLKQRYQKESGEGWHKISHIPKLKVWINGIYQY